MYLPALPVIQDGNNFRLYLNTPKSTATTNTKGSRVLNKGSRAISSRIGKASFKSSFRNESAPPPWKAPNKAFRNQPPRATSVRSPLPHSPQNTEFGGFGCPLRHILTLQVKPQNRHRSGQPSLMRRQLGQYLTVVPFRASIRLPHEVAESQPQQA